MSRLEQSFLLFVAAVAAFFPKTISSSLDITFEKCTAKLNLKISDNGECNYTDVSDFSECNNFQVCRKVFNIVHLDRKAYNPRVVSEDLLQSCCGNCVKSNITRAKKISEIPSEVKNNTHFIFPVLGRREVSTMYGYRFLPVVETSSIFYVAHNRKDLLKRLIVSCLNMWPLIVICVMMVVISGAICWLMETRGNKEEFPRPFMAGWFEGIWWSFISMTTVGYGDKAPKSIAARLFSIIWIIVGITTFSIVTAMLTSEIFRANTIDPPRERMVDARVGVVREHIYEAILISNHGGILVEVDRKNITDGIHKLVSMLHESDIDGFVLDGYELMLFFDRYKDHPVYKDDINYIRSHTSVTEVKHFDQLSYGVLVRDEEDYQFLSGFVLSNRDVIDSCTSLYLNNYSRKVQVKQYQKEASMFSVQGALFWPSFVACAVFIFVILVCGVTYEIRKKSEGRVFRKSQLKVAEKRNKKRRKFFKLRYRKKALSLCSVDKEDPLVTDVFGKV